MSKRERLIIENRSSLSMYEALDRARDVVNMGRVSDDGKSYCLGSAYSDGICVWADLNKASDRLVIVDYERGEHE